MKDLFKNPLVLLITFTLIAALTIGYAYVSVINPLVAEKEKLEKKNKMETTLLLSAKQRVSDTQNDTIVQIKSLHDQVPAKPYVGQFLFSIEKAKVISDSEILNLEVSQRVLEDEKTNKVTVSLSVTSPNYFAMQTFLKSLENNKRITTIDDLSFSEDGGSSNGEDASSQLSSQGEIVYDVTLSTYFFPKYKAELESLPMKEIYNVGSKTNPLFGTKVNPDDVELHAVLNQYVVAINSGDVDILANIFTTPPPESESDSSPVAAQASELIGKNLNVELLSVAIDTVRNSQASVNYVQKVSSKGEGNAYKSRIIEGTYVLKKINGTWKIHDIFKKNELFLSTE
jgi:type IV pilus assembly protein PilO